MPMKGKRYIPNTAEIIYQMIDGEYIFLNQKNGNYFSLDNLGVIAWEFVMHSIPVEGLYRAIQEVSPAVAEEVIASLEKLYDDLEMEGLSRATNGEASDQQHFLNDVLKKLRNGEVVIKPTILHSYKNIQEKYAHPCGVKEI